jgi:SAM-dependent methyltransferase
MRVSIVIESPVTLITMATPHKLALYESAVQHAQAEVDFLLRAYGHHNGDAMPALLKEDFAGSAAIARLWVLAGDDNQALAVDSHGPTVRWAARQAARELGARAGDLHFVCDDVRAVRSPRVDVVAAMNFSTFIYHTRDAMLAYLRHARRSLRPGGVLALDAFGGPGAMRVGEQPRPFTLPDGERGTYIWQQRSFNAVTHRIDCRIHFRLPDGKQINNAFRYDWRLWTLPELVELMQQAGFATVNVWHTQPGDRTGRFAPVKQIEPGEDWVAYVVGWRG